MNFAESYVFHRICSDDCVGGGHGNLSTKLEAIQTWVEQRSKSWNSRLRKVSEENLRKSLWFWCFLMTNKYFTKQNSWFRYDFERFSRKLRCFTWFSGCQGIHQTGFEALSHPKLPKWRIFWKDLYKKLSGARKAEIPGFGRSKRRICVKSVWFWYFLMKNSDFTKQNSWFRCDFERFPRKLRCFWNIFVIFDKFWKFIS